MAGKIQNEDIKTSAELVSAGATAASLPNDTKIWVTANSILKTLFQAIVDGDIGGSRSVSNFTGTSVTPSATKKDETFNYTGASPQTFSTTGFGTLASLTDGYRATIIGTDDTNTLTIDESDITNGRVQNGSITLGRGQFAIYEYSSNLARMVCVGRSL